MGSCLGKDEKEKSESPKKINVDRKGSTSSMKRKVSHNNDTERKGAANEDDEAHPGGLGERRSSKLNDHRPPPIVTRMRTR